MLPVPSDSDAWLNSPGNLPTADRVASVARLGTAGPNVPFYDRLSFRQAREALFGATGRNLLRGPGQVSVNASQFRTFPIIERLKMKHRAEPFHVTSTRRFNGEAYYGANGALFADRIGFEIYPERDRVKPRRTNVDDATSLHARAFVECVRSRSKPPAVTGHRATLIGHLGNIAFKTGRKLKSDAAREEFPGDTEATKLLGREAREPWDLI